MDGSMVMIIVFFFGICSLIGCKKKTTKEVELEGRWGVSKAGGE